MTQTPDRHMAVDSRDHRLVAPAPVTDLSRRAVLRRLGGLAALLAVVGLKRSAIAQEAAPGPVGTGPTLTGDGAVTETPGTITVVGQSFTPGSRVYVVLYDQWGNGLSQSRWTSAQSTIYSTDRSQDTAVGFLRAGSINETFSRRCGTTAMVRAYDEETTIWSNWVDIRAGC
jgi:hypothetical protein